MKTKIFLLLIFLCNAVFICAQDLFLESKQDSVGKEDIVAQVDTIKITAEEFYYSYEFGPAFPKREKNSKSVHLKYLINEKLLALEGYKTGVMEQNDVQGMYNDYKADLASEEMFRQEILPDVKITKDEIDRVTEKKLIEYDIRWLYSRDENSAAGLLKKLKNGASFDSLFNGQLNDSVFINDRKMTGTLYDIYMKNPLLAGILDTLQAGIIPPPIHTDDGWYIIKVDNIQRSLINGEAEINKLRSESEEGIKKSKMGIKSDEFIKGLFDKENPVIKRDAFNLLRSYLGKFVLPSEKYQEWGLEGKLDSALSALGLKRGDKYPGIILVTGSVYEYSLDDFIEWYRDRSEYIKFSEDDLNSFSYSLENLVWIMARDRMLAKTAENKGYTKSPWVKKQTSWWRDKIAYSAYRNKLEKSIALNSDEIKLIKENKKSKSDIMSEELSKKVLHKVLQLRQEHKVIINKDILDKIKVSSENDRKAIDIYFIKRGNLIPRTLYPSIDNDWISWE